MFRKSLLTFVALCAVALAPVAAQTDAKTAEAMGATAEVDLIAQRVAFIKAFYAATPEQLDKLQKALEARTKTHAEYMADNELMLRRRTTAISVAIPQEKTLDAASASALSARYQEDIYRIHEAAPLSLTNAVRMFEDMIDADARRNGRAKIESFFAKQLAGQPLDPARLDRLVLEPVATLDVKTNDPIQSAQRKLMGNERASMKREMNKPDAVNADILKAREAAIRSKNEARNNADPHAGHNHAEGDGHDHGTPPPAAGNRKIEVETLEAPPLDQWETAYQTWATNYEFSPAQKESAASIYTSCMSQAQSRLKGNETKIKEAEAISDPGERAKAMREAMKSLDAVFTQMKLRIDSVASIEQRERYKSETKSNDAGATDTKKP